MQTFRKRRAGLSATAGLSYSYMILICVIEKKTYYTHSVDTEPTVLRTRFHWQNDYECAFIMPMYNYTA